MAPRGRRTTAERRESTGVPVAEESLGKMKVHCWMEEKIQFIISRVEKTEVQKAFSVSLFRSPDCSRPVGVLAAWQGEGQPGMRKKQTRNSIKST